MGNKSKKNQERIHTHIEFWQKDAEKAFEEYLEYLGYEVEEANLVNDNGIPIVEAEIYGLLDRDDKNAT